MRKELQQMNSILENIAARDAHTAALRGDQPIGNTKVPATGRKPALTAAQAEEALFGWIYKQPGMPTAEDCQRILTQIADELGAEDAKVMLQRFGSESVKAMPMCLYARFFERASICLQFGVSPAFGFVEKDEIHSLGVPRDRWLLWHPESECLFEHRGKIGKLLNNGDVEDVSGIPEYEARFVREKKK